MEFKTIPKMILLVSITAAMALHSRPAFARLVVVTLFGGTVFADGRPIEKAVAVRLEAENSALVATTYTGDLGRFLFRNLELDIDEGHYLVINEPGFKELRYWLGKDYFLQDSAMASIVHSRGSVMLDLVRIPPEKKVRQTGPMAVDARQLKAEISEEARREYNLALKDGVEGKSREMLGHLEKAIGLAPEYYDALTRLGSEYMKAGQPEKARLILERAQALNPNDPIPLTNLGILQFQQGENVDTAGANSSAEAEASFRNALELFEKALQLNPRDPRVNLYLGIVHYKLGSYDQSEQLLVHALALDERMYEARLTLISIYSRVHRYKDALTQIAEYLRANPDAPQRKQLEGLQKQIQESSAERK
jgi:tetratricopeptide (TPR) repeat protein